MKKIVLFAFIILVSVQAYASTPGGSGSGVTKAIAGTGITLSPTGGTGDVTITATGAGATDTECRLSTGPIEATGLTYTISVSSPFGLGTLPIVISKKFEYAVTISTIYAACIGGTNAVFMVEQRAEDSLNSAGTDVWSGDVTATQRRIGGLFGDKTMPVGYHLVLVPTSVSGDVGNLMIYYKLTNP